ncbi:unnamed protein product [Prorocentrum cordatum]|uniref:CCHC-type domain-containing protein n=1 Tax=Prorocentrum cordatum TaxID=2364126 RepID=A0ABN9VC02_9DINO|nr:unnamed protein product [Polarella glacialis]
MAAIDVVDVRTDMRLQRFDGTDERWADWSLRFEAYTALLGMEDLMTEAANRRDPLATDQLGDQARAVSQRLWHLLITWCDGKSLGVVKLSRKNGLEAWRQLKIEYESKSGNRWTAMLRFILNPQDKWAKDRESGIDFFQSLTAWEAIVAEYVDQSGEAVSDNVRVSVLLEHAPEPYREVLRQAPEEVKLTFAAARSHIRGYYNQGRTFTHVPDTGGVVPMQVDAVRVGPHGGKSHGKSGKTGKMDKSGKAGKNVKGCKDSKTKSKNRDGKQGHGKGQSDYFDGECGYCGKWGHKRADCRKKKADEAKKETGNTRAVQGDGSASSSGQQQSEGGVRAASGYYDGVPDGWVVAVSAATSGQVAKVGGSILIDSGSDDHLCRHKFVPEAPVNSATDAPRLFDVQQRPLPTAGLRGVEMTMQEGIKATADFLVADVNDDLLSMGKLLRQGFRFNLSMEDGLYMTKGHRSVQLELERNSLRLPIVSASPAPAAHHCCGAADQQQAATAPVLTAESSVGAMRTRLRELFMPIYGTKLELWERLIVAEAAARRSEAERLHKLAVKEQLGIQHDPVEPKQLPVPKAPSAEEERQHRLTHLPAAPWCEECVRAKAPDAPHSLVRLEDSEQKHPLISYDFGFCKTADEEGDLTKVEDTYATMLVAFSSDTGVVKVIPCASKAASPYAIAGIKSFVQRLETGKCRLRTDTEQATKAIMDGVVSELAGKVTAELTPKHSSQSNPAEAAVKIVEGQTRVLRLDIEKRYDTKVTAAMPIWAWMMRHAGWLHERFSRRAGGQSPHEIATGTPYKGDICNFGETVLYRIARPAHRGLTGGRRLRRGEAQWGKGIWVGRSDESQEHLVMTPRGLDRARTVRRLPEGRQADKELLMTVTGLPWAARTAPERSKRRRAPQQIATELPRAEGPLQPDAPQPQQAGQPEGGAAPAQPQAPQQPPPPAAAAAQQPQPPAPEPPAPRDVAMGAAPSQAARRGVSPAAEVSEGKRARVAAVHALEVGNVDDSPDAFWEEVSDEVEDPTDGMFDVDMQDELDKKLTMEHLQSLLDHGVGEDIAKSKANGMKHITTRWERQWRWKPGFRDELKQHVTFSGGEIHEYGITYEHLKRLRTRYEHGTELQANPKYLDYVVETLNLGGSNTAPTPGVPAHKALMGSTPTLSQQQAGVYRSCVGALMYYVQDRADCQCEVSLLGRMLSGPTVGAFTALKRLVRYLLGTRNAVNWLPRPTEGTNVELVGFGDSDWAGDLQTRRSQSSGKIEIDGVPMHSFSRRQSIVATSSGVAEYYAATAVAEDLLYFKSLLEFMGFTVAATLLTDSSAARGIARREGVGKVRSLEARVLWLQQAIKRKLMDLGTVGTDDNKADLGTKILGHDRFVKLRTLNGIYTDMGQVAESDHQSEEVDFDVGAAARVRSSRTSTSSLGASRSAALAMITAAATLLQGCEGQVADQSSYYYDTEVCSRDGMATSDWTGFLMMVAVWTLIVAAISGYAGFRYASMRDSDWVLVSPEPNEMTEETTHTDKMEDPLPGVPASLVMMRPSQPTRNVSTQSQMTYKWKWAEWRPGRGGGQRRWAVQCDRDEQGVLTHCCAHDMRPLPGDDLHGASLTPGPSERPSPVRRLCSAPVSEGWRPPHGPAVVAAPAAKEWVPQLRPEVFPASAGGGGGPTLRRVAPHLPVQRRAAAYACDAGPRVGAAAGALAPPRLSAEAAAARRSPSALRRRATVGAGVF